jgi:hypothetical protein
VPLLITFKRFGGEGRQVMWVELTRAEIITRFAQRLLLQDAQSRGQAEADEFKVKNAENQRIVDEINRKNEKLAAEAKLFHPNIKSLSIYGSIIAILLTTAALGYRWLARAAKRAAQEQSTLLPPIVAATVPLGNGDNANVSSS